MDNLQALIQILPVYQSLIFSGLAFLMYLRGEGYHRFTLGLFMLGNAALFAIQALWNLGETWGKVLAFLLSLPIWLLQLPLFYFFLKSVLQPNYILSIKDTKHILPVLFGMALMAFFGAQPTQLKESYLAGEAPQTLNFKIFRWLYWLSIYGGIYLQFLIYIWYSQRRYPEYLKNILNFYSNPEHYSLSWLRWILFLFIVFYLTFDIIQLLHISIGSFTLSEFTLLLIFLNFSIGFFGLSQPDTWFEHRRKLSTADIQNLHQPFPETTETQNNTQASNNMPREATLNPTQISISIASKREEELLLKAETLMLDKKPWLDPEFNIGDLASMLGVNVKYISKTINTHTGMTFSQWVNIFRIREAEQLLLSDATRQYSLEGIYSQCGFTNKNTFLNAFKKIHGMTPTQYRQKKSEIERNVED